jgi:hypothetical protein
MEQILKVFSSLLILIFTILYESFCFGYVATKLSEWFIIPIFNDFPVLTWVQYAGIMFFVSCFNHSLGTYVISGEYKISQSEIVFGNLIHPWLLLFYAWIFLQFI